MQIDLLIQEFEAKLKKDLITHENTKYFVYRTPKWGSHDITIDGWGQRVNGVIKVGYTVNKDYPIWSPISTLVYENYINGNSTQSDENVLVKQIVELLYSVRNNLFHAGKRFDDAKDVEVVKKAIPLLKMIISNFIDL